MCYKYLWDNSVACNFPSEQFFDFFHLNPHRILCEDLKVSSAGSGFTVTVSQNQGPMLICFLRSKFALN